MITAAATQHVTSSEAMTPSEQQALASDPRYSVWVTASAGSGKTTVLVARVLRLLLPSPDFSREGVPPHRILAITYTRAAAAHMKNKIQERLSEWAIWNDEKLRKDLHQLIGTTPSEELVAAARRLFTKILDESQGLNIHTIHAFCQSVLARFPLEAELSSGFEVVDESESHHLLRKALHQSLVTPDDLHRDHALNRLTSLIDLDKLTLLIGNLLENRAELASFVSAHDTPDTLCAKLSKALPKSMNYKEMVETDKLRAILPTLLGDNATNQKMAQKLAAFCENDSEMVVLVDALLTKDKKDIKPRALTGILKKDSALHAIITKHQDICLAWLNDFYQTQQIENTAALLYLARRSYDHYCALKNQRSILDYEDLIFHTRHLLKNTDMAWVHFKLDHGIDHVLVDEAQDTSPMQWDIILSLIDNFFEDTTADRPFGPRSIFVVGDQKQSIYSFRGADPDYFLSLRKTLRDKITQAAAQSPDITPWREIEFTRSFRTIPLILDVVDQSFHDVRFHKALGQDTPLKHIGWRELDGGQVDILPPSLMTKKKTEKKDDWVITLKDHAESEHAPTSAQSIWAYARAIAQQIHDLIHTPHILPALGRGVQAGDILVLFETRNALTNAVIRALKEKSIPVSGIDRLVLNDHIAVQDLLAAISFACLPHDDMALACLLKSPLIGWSEHQLYHLAVARPRDTSLWQALKHSDSNKDVRLWLENLIEDGATLTPYHFLERILYAPIPAHINGQSGLKSFLGRLGQDTLDPLQELLNLALKLENADIRTCRRFLSHIRRGRTEVKREMDDKRNEVRIMTIHAAKGLEAPVVILPDALTTRSTLKPTRFLWGGTPTLPVPLWAPSVDEVCAVFRAAHLHHEEVLKAEKQRLLYVAMTRARDHLVIGGKSADILTDKAQSYADQSWYNQIKQAALRMNPSALDEKTGRVTLRATQKKDPDVPSRPDLVIPAPARPAWVDEKVTAESLVIKRLRPSQMGIAHQGLSAGMVLGQDRFLRGQITHKLFQLLPDYPTDQHHALASRFVAAQGSALSAEIQASIVAEVLRILVDDHFAPVFGPGSRAEVPISGRVSHDVVISGQIDRLVVLPSRILVVDFKTNRPSPENVADIPESYRMQLQAYVTLLQRIYPDHAIEAALLWTDIPRLMSVITP